VRRHVVRLMRLGGFSQAEALALTWDDACAWLESAVDVERELSPVIPDLL